MHRDVSKMKRSKGSRISLSLKKRKKGLDEDFENKDKVEDQDDRKQGDSGDKAGRFSFVSSALVATNQEKIVPQNTEKATQWAMKAFQDWLASRKEHGKEVPSDDILLSDDKESICNWLSTFFLEVRKGDGQPYSLSSLLSGIHRYIQANSAHDINVQQQKGEFKRLHTLLDNLYRQLHQQGIGTTKAQASIITESQEHQLWASSTFNNETPQGIINAVFYYNGINFVLRGGAEHRMLTVEQLFFGTEESNGEIVEFVEYTEFGSKNRPGGTKQLNMNKTVRHYAQPALKERCHVYLLKLYISLLTPDVTGAGSGKAFYYKPLTNILPGKPWFTSVPIGHNKLDHMLKSIFGAAGLDPKNFSNHSLRATSISRLYRASIPENVIMERSGHLSTDGVRSYERTSVEQLKSVSEILSTTIPLPDTSNEKENEDPNEDITEKAMELKPEPVDSSHSHGGLRPFHIQGVSGCTFNINVTMK